MIGAIWRNRTFQPTIARQLPRASLAKLEGRVLIMRQFDLSTTGDVALAFAIVACSSRPLQHAQCWSVRGFGREWRPVGAETSAALGHYGAGLQAWQMGPF